MSFYDRHAPERIELAYFILGAVLPEWLLSMNHAGRQTQVERIVIGLEHYERSKSPDCKREDRLALVTARHAVEADKANQDKRLLRGGW